MTGARTHAAYRLPPRVAVVEGAARDDTPAPVYLATLPTGPIVVLEDAAAVIWRAATTAGQDWVGAAAAEMGGTTEEAGADIRAFVDDLVSRGLLVRAQDAGATG